MAFTRSLPLAILVLTSAAFQARHDGKSHQGAHAAADLRPRQVNGAAGGIQSLSSRTAILSLTITTDTSTFSTALIATASPPSNSQPTNEPIGEIDPYIFPSSIVQVAVATICPDTPSASLINATATLHNGSSTIYLSTTPTPISLHSPISVCYPDTDPNCASTFSITHIPLPDPTTSSNASNTVNSSILANPTARILLDSNGCQTIYAPAYTAICRTTVKLIGIPDVTVSECDQMVTFSSNNIGCASTTDAEPITTSAGTGLPTITPTAHAGTYYAAHWVDVARGGVPAGNVVVEECEDAAAATMGVACETFTERWYESSITGLVRSESVGVFSGVSFFSYPFPSLSMLCYPALLCSV